MSDVAIIFLIVIVVALLAAVAYLGLRGHRQLPQPPIDKEPTFNPQDDNTTSYPPENTKVNQLTDLTSSVSYQSKTAPMQSSLPMDYGQNPQLPKPDKKLLVNDICYVIHCYGNQPLKATDFQYLIKVLGAENLSVHRLLAYDEQQQTWLNTITSAHRYWLIALPLANRSGRLDEKKISLIEEIVRKAAQPMALRVVFASGEEALKNSRLLDDFCNAVDVVLEFRLYFQKKQTLSQLAEILQMQQMVSINDRYIYRLESETFFTAHVLRLNDKTVRTLTFFLDAPKVSSPERAFDILSHCLTRTANIVDAKITDAKGDLIDDNRMIEIKRQLSTLQKEMKNYGVLPGGEIAHLLFS